MQQNQQAAWNKDPPSDVLAGSPWLLQASDTTSAHRAYEHIKPSTSKLQTTRHLTPAAATTAC